MEKQIYSALKGVILHDLYEAWVHMDNLEFLNLIAEIKESIQVYERKVQI